MGFVSILRLLWRHRILVAMGFAFALPIGVLVSYKVSGGFPPKLESRQYQIGVASAAVLVDSKSSQIGDLGDPTASAAPGILTARAHLLANLMSTSPLKERIAARARVPANRFITKLSSSNPNANIPTSHETTGAVVDIDDPAANVLNLTINDQVPIITANVQAPDSDTASRIASASIAELQGYLVSATGNSRIPDARKLVASPLGEAKAATETHGRGLFLSVALFTLVFAAWCGAIVVGSQVIRMWREAPAEGEPEVVEPPVPVHPGAGGAPPRPVPGLASAPPPIRAVGGDDVQERQRQPQRPRRAV